MLVRLGQVNGVVVLSGTVMPNGMVVLEEHWFREGVES